MKPAISRAMATLTTLAVLPRALSRSNAKPSLRFPPDVANDFWQCLDAIDLATANAWFHTVRPGTFNRCTSGVGVSGLVNAAASDGLATRLLARDEAKIGHELARV
jgi:hypothetical protein